MLKILSYFVLEAKRLRGSVPSPQQFHTLHPPPPLEVPKQKSLKSPTTPAQLLGLLPHYYPPQTLTF